MKKILSLEVYFNNSSDLSHLPNETRQFLYQTNLEDKSASIEIKLNDRSFKYNIPALILNTFLKTKKEFI